MLFIWVLFWIVFANIRMFPYYIIDVLTFPRKNDKEEKNNLQRGHAHFFFKGF